MTGNQFTPETKVRSHPVLDREALGVVIPDLQETQAVQKITLSDDLGQVRTLWAPSHTSSAPLSPGGWYRHLIDS